MRSMFILLCLVDICISLPPCHLINPLASGSIQYASASAYNLQTSQLQLLSNNVMNMREKERERKKSTMFNKSHLTELEKFLIYFHVIIIYKPIIRSQKSACSMVGDYGKKNGVLSRFRST